MTFGKVFVVCYEIFVILFFTVGIWLLESKIINFNELEWWCILGIGTFNAIIIENQLKQYLKK